MERPKINEEELISSNTIPERRKKGLVFRELSESEIMHVQALYRSKLKMMRVLNKVRDIYESTR